MEPDKSRQDDAPILVVPYDAAWPRLFEEERVVLENLLTQWLVGSIEHVGSTAVPGLAAKPVIDIMAGVKSLDDSRPAIPVLAAIDYCYFLYQPSRNTGFASRHLHFAPTTYTSFALAANTGTIDWRFEIISAAIPRQPESTPN
jgi:GrpB-like predicted nucleotidyltransferase (UPF0157 family)